MDEKVCQVCKECSIYKDIMTLDNKFETIMSNGINNFSGGQIKRLSIARAILQNKDILLIDEPTSGLDFYNAKMVIECIRKYANKKVVIVITHDKLIEEKCIHTYRLVNGQLIRKI